MTVLILLISGFYLYNYLDKTIKLFKQDVIKSFESSIDKVITYDSISPSILQYLEIRNLFITDSTGVCLVKIDNFKISFSLYKYFFTDNLPIGSIYVKNSSIAYDHVRDFETLKKVLSSFENTSIGRKRKLKKLEIKGRNISLSTNIPSGHFTLKRLFLDIDFSEENISIDFKTSVSGKNIPLLNRQNSFTSDIKISGKTGRDFSWNSYDIELENFKTDDFFLKKQNFNINHSGRKIKLIKTRARDPFDLYADYDIEDRILSVSGKAENYYPSKYIKYYRKNKTADSLIKSVYSGTALVLYRFSENTENQLTYTSDLSISVHKSLIPFKNRINAVVTGNKETVSFSSLDIVTEKGNISYRGFYNLKKNLPEGDLVLRNIKAGNSMLINSDISVKIGGENRLFILSDTEAGDLKLYNIECVLNRSRTGISYMLSYIDAEKGFISSEGFLSTRDNQPSLSSETEIRNISLQKLSSVFGATDIKSRIISENIYLNTKLYLETDFRELKLFSYDLSLNDSSGENSISSELSISGNSITFYNIVIEWKDYSGKGNINLASYENSYDIDSILSLNNEFYNFKGNYSPGTSLVLTGNSNFNLSAFFNREKTVFSLYTEKFPLPLYGSAPEFSLNIKGETDNGKVNIMLINNIIYNVPFLKGDDSRISFTAGISDTKFTIPVFSVKDKFSEVKGNSEFNFEKKGNLSGWIKGRGAGRNEEHLVLIDYEKGYYEITAEFSNFPSERVTDMPVSGDVSGIFTFRGSKANPFYSLDIKMENGKLLDDPFFFDMSVNASSGSMSLNNLKVRHNLHRIDSASGFISKDEGRYSFTGSLFIKKSISDKGSRNDIELSGDIFDSTFKWFSNPFFVENKGILKVSDNQNLNPEFREWELSYINNESFLIFNGGPANSIDGEITRKGLFNINLAKPLPVSGRFSGNITNGIINSDFENIEIDLNTFGTVTDIQYFKAESGTASGNLKLSGPVNDPEFSGHLNVSGVKASSVFIPAELILPNTSFIFSGKTLTMPETGVSIEDNSITAKVNFFIDHWLPREFHIDIKTDPGKMLWIKHRFAMLDIDGFASGSLVIDGDDQGLKLSGDLVARRCIITLSDEDKDKKTEKRRTFDYEIDLKITSGPGVEFFWPSVRLPVLRTYAAAGEKLSIYSSSATEEYSLNGDIKIQGGEVFYFSQSFFVKEGNIVFNENETKFDPHLTARAELRERTSDNKEVKISLIADDTPLSRFSPRFESSPPLSENEIYSLLGESVYSQFGGENITFGTALLGAGSYSTQLIGILRPFESRMKQMLNLDLFSIRTNFLQQAFTADIETDATLADDNTPVYNNYLDNTTIYMGKYFGEYFFLEGLVSFNSRDFDIYEYNDYDVPDFMGMHIKTELSLEVDTPLFLMDLTLYPQINNFYNSLLDTSLGFSWRFSY